MSEREEQMLELMRECTMTLRRCENKLNEIWAEWTRTHGLKGIPGREIAPPPPAREAEKTVVRRVIRR